MRSGDPRGKWRRRPLFSEGASETVRSRSASRPPDTSGSESPPSNPAPPPTLGPPEARKEEGTQKVPAAPKEPIPFGLELVRTVPRRTWATLRPAPATALPGRAAAGAGRRGQRSGAGGAAHSPGVGDEVVHGDLHCLPLGDVAEGLEDELVVKGI